MRSRGLAALAALGAILGAPGCDEGERPDRRLGAGERALRVACLGDSNTQAPAQGETWCELLADPAAGPPAIRSFNLGVGGAMIRPTVRESPEPPGSYRGEARPGVWAIYDGHGQLGLALERHAPLDYALAAFGTNDLRAGVGRAPSDPERITDWYQVLRERAAREGVLLLIARTPAILDATGSRLTDDVDTPGMPPRPIRTLNDRIDARFPPELVVDFRSFRESGASPSAATYTDRLHLGPSGHRQRAQEARARIAALSALDRYDFAFRAAEPGALGGDGTVAGLRLGGDLFLLDFRPLARAALHLPLAEPLPSGGALELAVRVHPPNGPPFGEDLAADLGRRPVVAARSLRLVPGPDGEGGTLGGPAMRELVAEALAHRDYRKAAPNVLIFSLARSDAAPLPLRPRGAGDGDRARLETCFGRCPPP